VRKDIFVLKTSGTHTVDGVFDVSGGSLVLKYAKESCSQLGAGRLHIFGTGGVSHLANVPVNTVSDIELRNDVEFSTIRVRRMRVAFKGLTETSNRPCVNSYGRTKPTKTH
jgi:hypothetical protein